MARLKIEVEIPTWSVHDLRRAVHDLDEADSGEGDGKAADRVTATDVFTFVVTGQLGVSMNVIVDELTEA